MANQTFRIINAIRLKRVQLGYSQEYMAHRLGLTQNAYCKIELGYTRITLAQLFLICDFFGVDVIDMLEPRLKSA